MSVCNDQKCINLYSQFIIYILICKIVHQCGVACRWSGCFLSLHFVCIFGSGVCCLLLDSLWGLGRTDWWPKPHRLWLVSHSSSMISQAFGSIGTVGRWWILLGKEVSISIKACQQMEAWSTPRWQLLWTWWTVRPTATFTGRWHGTPNHHSLKTL